MYNLFYRSLGQEVYLSVQEADYEIASYARQQGCMGILGQDSDFIIYDRFVQIKEFSFSYNKNCICTFEVRPIVQMFNFGIIWIFFSLVLPQCPLLVCGKAACRNPDHCPLRPTEALSKCWIGHQSVATAGLSSWK